MDWTPMIGRRRPVEQDALRIATLVHQLGERDGDRWFIDSESRLQQLDHLVRHPIDLAYVLLDGLHRRPPEIGGCREVARQVRRLLDGPSQPRRRRSRRRPFDPGSWERWDDVLGYLGCRDLLRTEPAPQEPEPAARLLGPAPPRQESSEDSDRLLAAHALRYRLTGRGARWLEESVYPVEESLAPTRERCELLRTMLPRGLDGAALDEDLAEIGRRLDAYRQEEIRPEDDLLSHLFQATFKEPL